MEICTCNDCSQYTVTLPDGGTQKGLLVHCSTRNRHLRRLATQPVEVTLSRLFPNLYFNEEAKGFQVPQLNKPKEVKEAVMDSEEDESDSGRQHLMKESEIAFLVLEYVMWLHLECGLSQQNSQKAHDQVIMILESIHQRHQIESNLTKSIPHDIRTIIKKLQLNVSFEQYICCSECYSLYDLELAPDECSYKSSPSSQPCGTNLFHSCWTLLDPQEKAFIKDFKVPSHKWSHGQVLPKSKPCPRIPKKQFFTQSLTEWIKWLLNVPSIEETIEEWKEQLESLPPEPIFDVAQGSNWKIIFPNEFNNNHLKLGYSLFVDWFNPLQNKLSGRQVSMGVIALNCLNLPPHLRHQTKHTFLAGIIPGPNQPNMLTINNILLPLVNELLELNNGVTICTPKFPRGRKVVIKIDFRKKPARPRGIRWSELNRLPYWNPVLNVTLGVMHNWFEGILQHHFKYQWGFGLRNQYQHHDSNNECSSGSKVICLAESNALSKSGNLSDSIKRQLLSNIRLVVVPKGVTRMRKQLGEPKSGALKASEWNALFNVYIPLSIIDIAYSFPQDSLFNIELFLINLCALVQCTNLVSSKKTKKEDSIKFSQTYETYQKTSFDLFENIRLQPNHHYAMHLPDHIDCLKTNHLIGDMEETLMKKFSQRQRLEVQMQDITEKENTSSPKFFQLTNHIYDRLFSHLRSVHPNLRDYQDLPHPNNSLVLPNYSKDLKSAFWKLSIKISSLQPNNIIYFQDRNSNNYGQVSRIIDLGSPKLHKGPLILLKVLKKINKRSEEFEQVSAFLEALNIAQIGSDGSYDFIPMERIICLAAYRRLPAWTLGISKPSFFVRNINKLVGLED
ncbi:hypothetical protein O181_018162 [Austropuccinia psidii MF-1]|uniref:Uncharacterized protein n=1 Tax=Austropuccinia psidii MF-1 TaxID=1389203 RepID=A0A9Q3C7B0_9BASI|nr:hypothetical protein [Austropuccinia psidii MF-1]